MHQIRYILHTAIIAKTYINHLAHQLTIFIAKKKKSFFTNFMLLMVHIRKQVIAVNLEVTNLDKYSKPENKQQIPRYY